MGMQPSGPPPSGTRWVMLAAVLASAMAFIDSTALNVALPALQHALEATGSDLLWVVNSYNLFLTSLLLLGGSLGDRYGRKYALMAGITLFAAASLVCGLAPNVELLLVARGVQGVGGALMVPGSLALLTASFGAERRGKVIGTWSAWCVIATGLGPVLGGVLAQAGLWRGVFFISLPLAAAALAVLGLRVPECREQAAPIPVDYGGAALAMLGLFGVNWSLIESASRGWRDATVLVSLAGGLAALLLFVLAEARAARPLLPLRLFRSRPFVGAILLTLCVYGGFNGLLLFLPLNLIQVQGYEPSLAGLSQLPVLVLMVALSPWAGSLADRHGPRLPLMAGAALAGAGFLLFALPGVTRGPADYWAHYLPALLVLGLGLGLTTAPLSAAMMNSLSSDRSGLASGINSTVARLAGVLAVSILGHIAVAAFERSLGPYAAEMQVPSDVRAALQDEAANLANARAPGGPGTSARADAAAAVKLSFVAAFRLIAAIACGLAWAGALAAALLIEGGKREATGFGDERH